MVIMEEQIQKAKLPKTSIPGQLVFEISAPVCSDDFVPILLNLTHFITLGTESNLKGFVWSYQSKTGLVSFRQFAPHTASF